MVTSVFAGPDCGYIVVITGGVQLDVTAPFSVKSSSLMVPFPVAPVSVNTTFTVPVRPVTGNATGVFPVLAPLVAMVPAPTAMPFIVMAHACAPVLLRCLQKLNELISSCFPAATLKESIIVGAPELFESAMACPVEPPKLVHEPVLLVQVEPERLGFITEGAAV